MKISKSVAIYILCVGRGSAQSRCDQTVTAMMVLARVADRVATTFEHREHRQFFIYDDGPDRETVSNGDNG